MTSSNRSHPSPADRSEASRVLIVENEAIVAMELEERLRDLGYRVMAVASSGEEAVEIVRRSAPDLVLMDIRLSGELDGIDAARQIRKLADTPLIYLTAHTDAGTLERAKRTEPVGYLPKPFDERSLRITLEMALYRHAAERRRKAAEAAQRRAEARHAAVLESSPDAILGFDRTGQVVFANRAASDMFALERTALSETSIGTLLPGVEPGMSGRVSSSGQRSDGEPFDAELSLSFVQDDEPLYMCIVRDVTEQRQLEHQLQHARKMEAVGLLATGVAHDFNNVLSVILGYAQLIERSIRREVIPSSDDVRQIIVACERASSLTQQLLIFSRKRRPQTQLVSVSETLNALGPMLARLLGEHIRCITKAEPEVHAFIDPSHLEQVVINLAVNARDAMPHGGALLVQVSGEGDNVVIEVTDSGEGMAPEVRSRIFEPFFTTKAPGRGTGLGLTTVARIVSEAGGRVEVESEPGRGTSFLIRLPRAGPHDPVLPQPVPLSHERSGATVLVVEDDDQLRQITARVLTEAGYRVLQARDAVEASVALHQHPSVDVLLSDVVLPDVGGPELAAEAQRARPGLKVLLVSGHTLEFIADWGAQDEPGLLLKPFTPEALLQAVGRLLEDGSEPG